MTLFSRIDQRTEAAHRKVLLSEGRLEVIPLKNLAAQLEHIPAGSSLSVTASPVKTLEDTLDLTQQLVDLGHDPVGGVLGVARIDHDAGAGFTKRQRHRAADPANTAGDDGRLALDLTFLGHGVFSPEWFDARKVSGRESNGLGWARQGFCGRLGNSD